MGENTLSILSLFDTYSPVPPISYFKTAVDLLWLGPVWAFAMCLIVVVAIETRGWGGRGGDVAAHQCFVSHGDQS